jgi:hypothetical protein
VKREGAKRKRRITGEMHQGEECKKCLDVVEAKCNTRNEQTLEVGVAE